MPSSRTGRPSPRYGVAVKKNSCPPRSLQSVVGLVDEKSLAGEVFGQSFGGEAVQGGMGTRKGVVERFRLTEVSDDPLHRTESAIPRALYQAVGILVRNLIGRHGHARMIGEGDHPIVPFDEPPLDLLLGCRDHRMGEALSEVHGHECDDLHGLARTRGLLDEDIPRRPRDIGHETHLIGP